MATQEPASMFTSTARSPGCWIPTRCCEASLSILSAAATSGSHRGLRPGAGSFERVWFNEMISGDEVSFDADAYLLSKARATALSRSTAAHRRAFQPGPTQPIPGNRDCNHRRYRATGRSAGGHGSPGRPHRTRAVEPHRHEALPQAPAGQGTHRHRRVRRGAWITRRSISSPRFRTDPAGPRSGRPVGDPGKTLSRRGRKTATQHILLLGCVSEKGPIRCSSARGLRLRGALAAAAARVCRAAGSPVVHPERQTRPHRSWGRYCGLRYAQLSDLSAAQ